MAGVDGPLQTERGKLTWSSEIQCGPSHPLQQILPLHCFREMEMRNRELEVQAMQLKVRALELERQPGVAPPAPVTQQHALSP